MVAVSVKKTNSVRTVGPRDLSLFHQGWDYNSTLVHPATFNFIIFLPLLLWLVDIFSFEKVSSISLLCNQG